LNVESFTTFCIGRLLIGVATGQPIVNRDDYQRAGLNSNHAFALLATKALPVGEGRFLLLRDPHGMTKYSDESITPTTRNYLKSISDESSIATGTFWISWSNFLYFFSSITISTYVSEHYDIREEARFTQSSLEPVSSYYFTVPR
jgi:hypothetical protein